MNHLGIYSRKRGNKDYIQMMFSGEKTIDIKLSDRRIPPYNAINDGDMLYVKESSGPVVGRILIPKVTYHEISDPMQILDILLTIQDRVGLDNEEHAQRMFERVSGKRYVTLFELAEPEALERPIRIEKYDRRVWVANYNLPIDLRLAYGLDPMITDEIGMEVVSEDDDEPNEGENTTGFGKLR